MGWGDYPGLSGWTLNPITIVLLSEAERDLIHRIGEEAVSDSETEIAVATRTGAATESWKYPLQDISGYFPGSGIQTNIHLVTWALPLVLETPLLVHLNKQKQMIPTASHLCSREHSPANILISDQ